jgi:uncharacterized phiE125 gp8 family phage protein
MPSKVITARADESVLTLATLRLALRIDTTTEDTLLEIWRGAAFRKAEHHCARSFGAQVRELALDEFPLEGGIRLPDGPVTSITSMKYIDENGDEQTMDSSLYSLDTYSDPQWVLPAVDTDWPTTLQTANAVKVRYAAGSNTLVEDVKLAIMMLVAHADANRGAIVNGSLAEMPLGVGSYLDHHVDYSGA